MVGCLNNPTTEEAEVAEQTDCLKIQSLSSDIKKSPSPKDLLDLCLPELEDFPASFSDSFLDFDSINSWFVEGQPELDIDQKMADFGENAVGSGSDKSDFTAAVEGLEMGESKICDKGVGEIEVSGRVSESMGVSGQEKCEIEVVIRSVEVGNELVDSKIIDEGVLIGDEICRKSVDSGCSIYEQLGKVNLDETLNASISSENGENVNGKMSGVVDIDKGDVLNSGEMIKGEIGDVMDGNGSGMKSHDLANDKGGNRSDDSESEDESSSSSSSSSSDEEDEHGEDSGDMVGGKKSTNKEGGEIDVEEGEILLSDADEIVGWSDNEDYEGGASGTLGPIASKNQLKILPPVPSITVTLQPHHQTLPVGIILSIIGAQVIVEGIEKHNPLNEGSILWITESRSPLGIVDEIFGPVKNPYYLVRYNFESEVPSNIQQGTSISFVSEFANHVLNDKSLYQKGYDASGDNDEELSDELEFSDDEKEAEYKKMLKMKKRGTSDSKPGFKQKDKRQFKNQPGNWKNNQVPAAKTQTFSGNLPPNTETQTLSGNLPLTEDKVAVPPVSTSLNNGNFPGSAGRGLAFPPNQAIFPSFPVQTPLPGFCPPNGVWGQGCLSQQPLSIGGLSSAPAAANFMHWMQQQNQPPFQLHQMQPVQNSTIPGLAFNLSSPVDQPNFGGAPAFAPWLGFPNQNVFNQSSMGMDSQTQRTPLPQNVAGPVFQNMFNQSSMGMDSQTQWTPLPQNAAGPLFQNMFDQSSMGMDSQTPRTPLPQNVAGPVFQCDGTQQSPVSSGNPQNFNQFRGGGRRGNHRGGCHYGGRRGSSQSR